MGRFRTRLLILVAALIILIQGLTLLAVVVFAARDAREQAQAQLQSTLEQVRQGLQATAARDRLGLSFLVVNTRHDAQRLATRLREFSNVMPTVDAVFLGDDGSSAWSTGELRNPQLQQRIRRHLADPAAPGYGFLALHDKPYQMFFVPVHYTAEEMAQRPPTAAPEGWVGLLVSMDRYVERWRQEFQAQPLIVARDASVADHRSEALDADTIHASLALPSIEGQVSVRMSRPLATALAPYHRIRNVIFVIGGIALALAVVFAAWVGRSATRPIEALARAAHRIEEGNYSEAVVVSGAVEFTRLAQSLNAMQSRISEREARIQHQATHDQLTGLSNLAAVMSQLGALLAKQLPSALILIDIRRFRDVNATLGHIMGNRLLVEFSRRLAELAGEGNPIGRVGGDEFIVLLPGKGLAEAHRFSERILAVSRTGLSVGSHTLKFDLRIGYCAAPEHGSVANEMLFRADIAREDARASGLSIKPYQAGRDEGYRRRLTLLDELRSAIAEDQLTLVYQPQVFTSTRLVKSFEVLCRWPHPQLGWIPPTEFIPLAEQSGAIAELTRWVLRRSLAQLADWHRQGLKIDIAVNFSATDLLDKELPHEVLALLAHYQLSPQHLVIELTESAVLREPEIAARVMEMLRIAGVRFSIDDFGTGYSSLAQLQMLPLDELKIDRSFILDLEKTHGNDAIVRSTIELGHTLGLKVVAEGIENGQVWSKLVSLGCDYGQGYFVSRPMPPENVLEWTTQTNARLANAVSDTAQVRVLSAAS